MVSLEITLLGMALAVDAAAVCFAMSLLQRDLEPQVRIRRGFILSAAFGIFQFLMLWAGSYVGYLFTFSAAGHYFHFTVAFVFLALSLKCFRDSYSTEDKDLSWSILSLLALAFVTSIDAFASGISLATIPSPYVSGLVVGGVTFFFCLSFYFLAKFFDDIPEKWLLRMAGSIFGYLFLDIAWSMRNFYY